MIGIIKCYWFCMLTSCWEYVGWVFSRYAFYFHIIAITEYLNDITSVLCDFWLLTNVILLRILEDDEQYYYPHFRELLRNLQKVTQVVSGRASIQNMISAFVFFSLYIMCLFSYLFHYIYCVSPEWPFTYSVRDVSFYKKPSHIHYIQMVSHL